MRPSSHLDDLPATPRSGFALVPSPFSPCPGRKRLAVELQSRTATVSASAKKSSERRLPTIIRLLAGKGSWRNFSHTSR
jgi:hypothetical protein